MTSIISRVPLVLYTRVLQHTQQSTEKEKNKVSTLTTRLFCYLALLTFV